MFAKYLINCCATFYLFVELSRNWKGLFFGVWQTDEVVVTKYICKQSTTICPLVGIENLPPPLSPASVPLPRAPRGWGAHSTAGEGLGESKFRRLKKSLALCLLRGGCVQYVFLGLDLEYATNWTDLTRALRLLAGKSIKLQGDVVYLCWPMAPSYIESKWWGRGVCGVSANEYSCGPLDITWHGAQINFGDLPPYLAYNLYKKLHKFWNPYDRGTL